MWMESYHLWGVGSTGGSLVVDLFYAHLSLVYLMKNTELKLNAMFLVRRGFLCSVTAIHSPHPTSALFPNIQGAQPAN